MKHFMPFPLRRKCVISTRNVYVSPLRRQTWACGPYQSHACGQKIAGTAEAGLPLVNTKGWAI
eukprot:474332-Amphidinium_carterae.1